MLDQDAAPPVWRQGGDYISDHRPLRFHGASPTVAVVDRRNLEAYQDWDPIGIPVCVSGPVDALAGPPTRRGMRDGGRCLELRYQQIGELGDRLPGLAEGPQGDDEGQSHRQGGVQPTQVVHLAQFRVFHV